ncbi:MAG: CPBP family intramembrane metalloprotease, partial [Lachnospiraceae bacterium]|nr:CPBP family intramembrane metalloprotease [Lachnospiraceae bacterium]
MMKRVTKTNVMFTSIILVYIIMIFTIRLVPAKINYNVLLILPEAVILLTALVVCFLLKIESLKEVELRVVSFGTCAKSFLLAFLCIPLISVINLISSLINGNATADTMTRMQQSPMWLSIILIAFIPAVVEEFVFRGLVFGNYKKRNPWKGVLLSALLFGLMHLNINQFSYAFVLGIVLALLNYATGSLIPSIILHFTINANSVVLSYLSSDLTNSEAIQKAVSTGDTSSAVNQFANSEFMTYLISIAMIAAIVAVSTTFAVLLFASICKSNR